MSSDFLLVAHVKKECLKDFIMYLATHISGSESHCLDLQVYEFFDYDDVVEVKFLPVYGGYGEPVMFYKEVKEWVTDVWSLEYRPMVRTGRNGKAIWESLKKEAREE